jgi:AraC family transcriptional regulator
MPQSRISLVNTRSGQLMPAAPQPSVILSSIQSGWEGLIVEHHRYLPKGEIAESYAEQHLLGLQLSPMTLEWRSQGRFQSRQLIPGDICIYARGAPFQQHWHEAGEVLHVALDPLFVAQIDPELVNPEGIAFVEQHGGTDPQIQHICLTLKAELETGCQGGRLFGEALAAALAVHLLRSYRIEAPRSHINSSGLSKTNLQRAIDYIHDHLGEHPTLAELAECVNLSPYHFARLFKQFTGRPPHQYVIQVRLEEASRLLRAGSLSVGEVAHRLGFADQSHLTRLFKRYYGLTPKAYLEQNNSRHSLF